MPYTEEASILFRGDYTIYIVATFNTSRAALLIRITTGVTIEY